MDKFNYTKEKADSIYSEVQAITSNAEANAWVAAWPGYGGLLSCTKNDKNIYACSNGFQINLSNYDVFAVGQQGVVRPRLAAFATEDGMLRKEFNGTNVDLGITIIPKNENEVEVILSSKELAGSMFTRMFYMEGGGLRYFKLFNHQRGLTGTNIYVYKVDFEGKNMTVSDYFKKPAKKEIVKEEIIAKNGSEAIDNSVIIIKNNTSIANNS